MGRPSGQPSSGKRASKTRNRSCVWTPTRLAKLGGPSRSSGHEALSALAYPVNGSPCA